MQEFKKARTYSSPAKPAQTLVTEGLYKKIRHPMCLSRLLQHIGIGIAFGNIWILIMVIPVSIMIWFAVIIPEESYLERRFGKKYLRYKGTVRF